MASLRARATSTNSLRPASKKRDPNQPSEVCLQNIRDHLPRLQSFCRGFPTAGRTSSPSSRLPSTQGHQPASSLLRNAQIYRRFLPQAAATQAPVHDVLSGSRIKDSHPIACTPELHKAFEEFKVSLTRVTLLAHPIPAAPLALVTDASTSAMGAVLQQRVDSVWQPLAFFS
jgi:hypothetical protein